MSAVAATDLAHLGRMVQRPGALARHTIYECPECGERLLGRRRCDQCNLFCRALGLGGACPDCDTVILLHDLFAEVPPA